MNLSRGEAVDDSREKEPTGLGALDGIFRALCFAADKHRDQRRKGECKSPYINHPIEVAELLVRVGGVTDATLLQAAILHDTLEDTETTPAELDSNFGTAVRELVVEVTDNKALKYKWLDTNSDEVAYLIDAHNQYSYWRFVYSYTAGFMQIVQYEYQQVESFSEFFRQKSTTGVYVPAQDSYGSGRRYCQHST